jgi:hypothetical protein
MTITSEQNNTKVSLSDLLENLLLQADGQAMSLRNICDCLSGRGNGVLVTVFSLPFSFPITVPGLSLPFGLLLAFLGLRIAFGKNPWWPNWILKKEVSYGTLHKVATKTLSMAKILQKVLKPRLTPLVTQPIIHRFHGLWIFVLALLLAFPVPIPLTSMVAAMPICCLGLGLLEYDGIAVIIAYMLSIVCFIIYGAIFYMGTTGLYRAFF